MKRLVARLKQALGIEASPLNGWVTTTRPDDPYSVLMNGMRRRAPTTAPEPATADRPVAERDRIM